jgi:ATP-dependent Clp protease protease subunit
MSEQRDLERLLKVHYADMPGLDTETQILFKQLEWGINLGTNTMYLTYEIDTDQLYSVMTRFDNFIQYTKAKKDVTLVISSYGGDVYAMLGTIDYFNSLPVKVNTHCIGACMSAAAVILACGTGKRTMSENSTVMVHEGSAFEVGKTSDVIKGADHINRILGDVTKKTQEFWEEVSKQDTYLTSKECLEYGIVDEIK